MELLRDSLFDDELGHRYLTDEHGFGNCAYCGMSIGEIDCDTPCPTGRVKKWLVRYGLIVWMFQPHPGVFP